MNTISTLLMIFVLSLSCLTQARGEVLSGSFSFDKMEERMRGRYHPGFKRYALRNTLDARSLFEETYQSPSKLTQPQGIIANKEETGYKENDVYKVYKKHGSSKGRPDISNISWSPLTPSSSRIKTRFNEQDYPDKATVAFDIYQNFINERTNSFTGLSISSLFWDKPIPSLQAKLFTSSSLRLVLGNVFSYFYRQDRQLNGYRPEHEHIKNVFVSQY